MRNIRIDFGLVRLVSLVFIISLLSHGFSAAETPVETELDKLQEESKLHFKEHVEPFLTRYCMDCHGAKRMKSGVNFAPAVKNPGGSAFVKQWKNGVAVVESHDMPPEDFAKQPSDEERQKFVEGVRKIKFLSQRDPGYFVMHRLTKVEYGNTLHDLFGVDPAIAEDLPDDVIGEGYLNTLSPLQLEQYLAIANKVVDQIKGQNGKERALLEDQLFGVKPAGEGITEPTVREIARTLGKKAFRRRVSEEELDVLCEVYQLGQKNKLSHQESLYLMLKAILVSPQFLFITPAEKVESNREIVPLDDYQLAARISYLLWASMPDEELMLLADEGRLHNRDVLKSQVLRLLSNPRARALFDGFGAQWLGLEELQDKTFDLKKYPEMTVELRQAMYEEARLFFESIVRENQGITGFVESNYSYLNEPLAAIYGLEGKVKGSMMQRVTLEDPNRGGILVMPGILATTSFPNRTSPVKRGVWVLEQVLGEHVPPAPANVPELDKQDGKKVENLTLRQRTELHRTDPVCANCHKLLDPIGFGLENFDAIGRWRVQDDQGGEIDATGELPGEKYFKSPQELKQIIGSRSEELAHNFVEKLMAYALCRQLEGYDEIVIDQLLKTASKEGYRVQDLICEVVTSYPFTNYRVRESSLVKSNNKQEPKK